MPRDKNKKFLKQKYAQQHKKTPARKHTDEDDIGLPAPIHHLDDAVSKKRNKKNKYASQSHKEERIKDEDEDDNNNNNNNIDDGNNNNNNNNNYNNRNDNNNYDNDDNNNENNYYHRGNYYDSHSNYTPLAIGTSTEEIIQTFENDSGDYNNNNESSYGGGSSHNTPRYGEIDAYSTNVKKRGGRHNKSMHSLSSIHGPSALWPVAETESLDISMSTVTGATTTATGAGVGVGGRDGDEVMSETGSTSVSEMTSQSEAMQEPLEQASAMQDMDTHLELLGSKDAIERIEALEKIVHLLCRRFFDDYFSAIMDKLPKYLEMLIQCLKRGDAAEQCLALQVVELIVTTVQGDMNSFCQEIRPVLVKLILEGMNTRVQSMAISAFTYLVWLSDNTSHVQSTLHFLEKLWKAPTRNEAKTSAQVDSLPSSETVEEKKVQVSNGSHSDDQQGENRTEEKEKNGENKEHAENREDEREEEEEEEENGDDGSDDAGKKHFKEEKEKEFISDVRFNKLLNANAKTKAVALQNWTWLISGLSVGGIASLLDAFEPELSPLLQANELTLRCASGEALTLLITNYKEAVENQDIVEEFELQPVEWNHVLETFITLRDGSDKKRKASEVRRQRREFRDFLLSLNENWKPEVTIKLQNTSIELKGWNECISYHRVKDIMGGGLQLHLMENEKLQTKLQIDVDEFAPQTQSKNEKEKKQKSFKRASRLQKESRKKQRQSKNAFRFEAGDNDAPSRKTKQRDSKTIQN